MTRYVRRVVVLATAFAGNLWDHPLPPGGDIGFLPPGSTVVTTGAQVATDNCM